MFNSNVWWQVLGSAHLKTTFTAMTKDKLALFSKEAAPVKSLGVSTWVLWIIESCFQSAERKINRSMKKHCQSHFLVKVSIKALRNLLPTQTCILYDLFSIPPLVSEKSVLFTIENAGYIFVSCLKAVNCKKSSKVLRKRLNMFGNTVTKVCFLLKPLVSTKSDKNPGK